MQLSIAMSTGLTFQYAYLTLQEEEDSSLDKAAIEALPAPPR